MKSVEMVKERVGEDLVWFLELPSYSPESKRGIAVVKPSPAELLFGEKGQDDGLRQIIISGEGEELEYTVVGLNEFLRRMILGSDLDVFLSLLDKNNLDESTRNPRFDNLFEMICSHYDEFATVINSNNYSSLLLRDHGRIAVAGDAVYLAKKGMATGKGIEKDVAGYNEMILKTLVMEYHVAGTPVGYRVKSFEEIDEESLSEDTKRYKRAWEDYRDSFEEYTQRDWSVEVQKWINSLLSLTVSLISS